MTSAPTPPDFRIVIRGLSDSIQDVMISWHNIQVACLRASLQPLVLRNSMAPLRAYLCTHWEGILRHLQKCHDFNVDVVLWQTALEGSDSGAYSFLEDLVSSSRELCHESEILIQQSDRGLNYLSSLIPQLSNLLQESVRYDKTSSTVLNTTSNAGTDDYYAPAAPRAMSCSAVTSPPDGLAAIGATKSGLIEIRNTVCALHQFWTMASETCLSLMKFNARMPLEDARQLAETWKGYQEEIMTAKVSITKSVDAVVIEPNVRRQQRRRGSSESTLPPRRTSSLDDAEVPKSCWGFHMLSFGERKTR